MTRFNELQRVANTCAHIPKPNRRKCYGCNVVGAGGGEVCPKTGNRKSKSIAFRLVGNRHNNIDYDDDDDDNMQQQV